MPRETISFLDNGYARSQLHVGWDNYRQRVQIGVELPEVDVYIGDNLYHSLWTADLSEIELNQVISALQKARRKTFHKRKIDE